MSVEEINLQIKGVLEGRARDWEQAKALNDKAKEESRELTAEERESWDRMMAEMRSKEERVAKLEADKELEQRNAEFESQRKRYAAIVQPVGDGNPAGESKEEREIRAFLKGETRSLELDLSKLRTHVERSTGRWEVRDLTVGTAATAGDTVPTSFVRQLYEHLIETSAIRQTNVTVLTTAGGESLPVPKTTAAGTAAIVGEGTALAENDPQFGKVTLGAWKYGQLIQVSRELIDDTGVDLLGFLARDAGRALANATGAHFCTGTGTNQPLGVFTAAGTGVTGGTGVSGLPTADNIIELFYSVIPPYRRGAFWLMSDGAVSEVRQLKDANNQYLWLPGLVAGESDRLLGKPVVTETFAPAMGTGVKSIAFGDFSAYYIRDVGTIRFERSDDFAFSTDLVTFRSIMRTDGDLVDLTGAIKLFRGGTS